MDIGGLFLFVFAGVAVRTSIVIALGVMGLVLMAVAVAWNSALKSALKH